MQDNVWVGLRPGRTPLRVDMEIYRFSNTNLDECDHPNSGNPPLSSAEAEAVSVVAAEPPVAVAEEIDMEVPLFHCYGHGGSGVTLAMGCVHDLVTNLVMPTLQKRFN